MVVIDQNVYLKGKNVVIIGESGSGKTELAFRIAHCLMEHEGKNVSIFDMDQTKSLYRLRDIYGFLNKGYSEMDHQFFFHGEEFMDSPIVPSGVSESLKDSNRHVILDVGGNRTGALCLGQYKEVLESSSPDVFYTINPFRSFSNTAERIRETMDEILTCCGLEQVRIVCNPYCGSPDLDMLKMGSEKLSNELKKLGLYWEIIMISKMIWEQVNGDWEKAICIEPYLNRVLDLDNVI